MERSFAMLQLIHNAEHYRAGPNYRATNIVFPVEFNGRKYIIKKPRLLASIIEAYYVFQDKFFYGTRRLSLAKKRLETEVKKLTILDGLHAPRLIAYDKGTIVREFLEGTDFRHLDSDKERKETLEEALSALEAIHDKGVITEGHVKNCIKCPNGIYWSDFDGVVDESDPIEAKAISLLKFVYSTYSATRNPGITTYSADLVRKRYQKQAVVERIRQLVTPGLSALRLWFPTRIPINEQLNRDIKTILRS